MNLIIYYILKKLKLDQFYVIKKVLGFVRSTSVYLTFFNLKNQIYNYNLNEYYLIKCTFLGDIIHTSFTVRAARFLGLLSLFLLGHVPRCVDFLIEVYGKDYYILQLLVSKQAILIYTVSGIIGFLINYQFHILGIYIYFTFVLCS